jgi:hypothetical protein
MQYKIFTLSEDGLLKQVKDKWDKYADLFDIYDSPEDAQKAIQDAVDCERIWAGIALYIIPFVYSGKESIA